MVERPLFQSPRISHPQKGPPAAELGPQGNHSPSSDGGAASLWKERGSLRCPTRARARAVAALTTHHGRALICTSSAPVRRRNTQQAGKGSPPPSPPSRPAASARKHSGALPQTASQWPGSPQSRAPRKRSPARLRRPFPTLHPNRSPALLSRDTRSPGQHPAGWCVAHSAGASPARPAVER